MYPNRETERNKSKPNNKAGHDFDHSKTIKEDRRIPARKARAKIEKIRKG